MNGTPTSPSAAPSRIAYIDAARGAATIGVILGHLVPMANGVGQYVYSWHMPVFFLLTGMLFYYNQSWKRKSLRELFLRKAQSLLYPYATFSILSIGYVFLKSGIRPGIRSIVDTACLDGILTLWFLPALFLAEMLFYCIMQRSTRKKVCLFLLASLTVTTLFSLLHFERVNYHGLSPVLHILNIPVRAMIGCNFLFFGYFFARLTEEKPLSSFAEICIALALGIVNLGLFRFNFVNLRFSIIGNPLLFYLNALAGSYAMIVLSRRLLASGKFLYFLGKNSLIVFATHMNLGIADLAAGLTHSLLRAENAVLTLALILLLETMVILVINRYLPFLTHYKRSAV